jgi:hypothetical protein
MIATYRYDASRPKFTGKGRVAHTSPLRVGLFLSFLCTGFVVFPSNLYPTENTALIFLLTNR